MKKKIISILIVVAISIMCVACGAKTYYYCGEEITNDSLKKDGRYYCDYDCYMCEVMGL